jgi:TatA/E family protein of Tat protein translocase
LILVIAILVIGPGKLPETGTAPGRAIRAFRDAVEDKETNVSAASDAKVSEGQGPRPQA